MQSTAKGSRSFHISVRAVSKLGKPCTQLKNHFEYESSYRTVIGYAEYKAKNDPERFIWVSQWKQMQDGTGKKKRQLYNCLSFLERLRLLIPVRRFRNKAWRHGWIVANHADLSEVSDRLCWLNIPDDQPPIARMRGQRRSLSAFEAAPSAFEKSQSAFPSAFESAFQTGSECISGDGNCRPDTELKGIFAKPEVTSPCQPLEPLEENPLKENPQSENQNQEPNPHSFFESTPDENQNPRASEGLTVSDVLENADVVLLSDGEFDSRFLSLESYPHTVELQECIQQVISESLSDSYVGRPTNVRLMRQVMTRLRQEHRLSVPRGWLPVMDKLRDDSVVRICRSFEPPPNLQQAAELRDLLVGTEVPLWYRQNRFITDAEAQEMCDLIKRDYDAHPEFWGLLAEESEQRMQKALAAYRETAKV